MAVGIMEFFRPTYVKVIAHAILFVSIFYVASVEPIGHHIETRPVNAGPHGVRNWAFVLNPLLFPFSYLAGEGETVYSTYQEKVAPEGFKAESILLESLSIHLPFYLALSYIIVSVITYLKKKGK